MDEFSLIERYFKAPAHLRDDVIFGIGDDAACVKVPEGYELLISTDTLVAQVHFLDSWDPYDIALKAVMVNVSDLAAMAASPCWLSLSLTLPHADSEWLQRFSQGLHDSLRRFDIALIGGDTTCGPLSLTLTIHGLAPVGRSVRRDNAKVFDKIYVSGEVGAAALAVTCLDRDDIPSVDKSLLMRKLKHPDPRIDLQAVLQEFASAAIDISDGLSADLSHICTSSGVGACIQETLIPIHPLVKKYQPLEALDLALTGGDDYELCFTVPAHKEPAFLTKVRELQLNCHCIGMIEEEPGLRLRQGESVKPIPAKGYRHF
jgi:thiamine-monophosphate kinase